MTAPLADLTDDRFTAEQRAKLAEFDAAPTPPEVAVENVARAICETRDAHSGSGFPCRCGWEAGFGEGWEKRLDHHRQVAAAAASIAAYRSAQNGGAEEDACVICGYPLAGHQGDGEMVHDYHPALAAQNGGAEEAVRRVEAVVTAWEQQLAEPRELLDWQVASKAVRRRMTGAVRDLRAALASPAPAPQDGAR